jgi:hypothetical protein
MELAEIEATVKGNLLKGRRWGPLLAVETHNGQSESFLFPDVTGSLEGGDADRLFHLGRSIEQQQGPIALACLVTNQGHRGSDGKPVFEQLVFSWLVTTPAPLIRARTYQVLRDQAGLFHDLLGVERDARCV